YQEKGTRYSRPLPYRLNVNIKRLENDDKINLVFENQGKAGAVYHVYDLNHLDRIPRRYTVEAGKSLADDWEVRPDQGSYDLEVYGPNGFFQKFSGNINSEEPEITVDYDYSKGGIKVVVHNPENSSMLTKISSNAYDYGGPWIFEIAGGKRKKMKWSLKSSGNWYDFSVTVGNDFVYRYAGRVETGKPSVSDPAMAMEI